MLERYLGFVNSGTKSCEEILLSFKNKAFIPFQKCQLRSLAFRSMDLDVFYNGDAYHKRVSDLEHGNSIRSNELDWPFRLRLISLHYCKRNQEAALAHKTFLTCPYMITCSPRL